MSKNKKNKENKVNVNEEELEVITPENEEKAEEPDGKTEEKVLDSFALELLAKADAKVKEYKELAQRVQAEFENYRKRTNDSAKTAASDGENGVILSVLPLMDTVSIAMGMVSDEKTVAGLQLIQKQFEAVLTKYGVEEIKAAGEVFNPDYHNAVMQVEDAENAGKVAEVLQKGYIRNGKVIRYAMVKVAA